MDSIQLKVRNEVIKKALFSNVSLQYNMAKRICDIVISIAAITILLPLLIITAVVIRIDSPGPAIFCQQRCGLHGRIFRMYKFRSMVADADKALAGLKDRNEAKGHMFKIRQDPRVTRIGRLIRKTSIDELPQFFNVLKGEMSIVGPRPPIINEVLEYERWHNLRLSVKPGITGLWQISGRNRLGFDEMVRLDLKYIRERSFLYDIKIIIKTIPVLLGDSKAF